MLIKSMGSRPRDSLPIFCYCIALLFVNTYREKNKVIVKFVNS